MAPQEWEAIFIGGCSGGCCFRRLRFQDLKVARFQMMLDKPGARALQLRNILKAQSPLNRPPSLAVNPNYAGSFKANRYHAREGERING